MESGVGGQAREQLRAVYEDCAKDVVDVRLRSDTGKVGVQPAVDQMYKGSGGKD